MVLFALDIGTDLCPVVLVPISDPLQHELLDAFKL
jgi:hypothetical protein